MRRSRQARSRSANTASWPRWPSSRPACPASLSTLLAPHGLEHLGAQGGEIHLVQALGIGAQLLDLHRRELGNALLRPFLGGGLLEHAFRRLVRYAHRSRLEKIAKARAGRTTLALGLGTLLPAAIMSPLGAPAPNETGPAASKLRPAPLNSGCGPESTPLARRRAVVLLLL